MDEIRIIGTGETWISLSDVLEKQCLDAPATSKCEIWVFWASLQHKHFTSFLVLTWVNFQCRGILKF